MQHLGLQTVKGILYMQATKVPAAKNTAFHHIATAIVEHSCVVAQIANYLSLRYFPDPDMAFVAGLLHDIGKLALLGEIADNYATEAGDGTYTEESLDDIMQPLHQATGVKRYQCAKCNYDLCERCFQTLDVCSLTYSVRVMLVSLIHTVSFVMHY